MQTAEPNKTSANPKYKVIAYYDIYEKNHGDGFFPQWFMRHFTFAQKDPDNPTKISPIVYLEDDIINADLLETNNDYSHLIIKFELFGHNDTHKIKNQYIWKQCNESLIDGLDGNAKPELLESLNQKHNEHYNLTDSNKIDVKVVINKMFMAL